MSEPALAEQHKALAAERAIAYVRLAVIVFNIAVYWPLLRPQGHPLLALVVSIAALAYALYVVAARPYLRYPILSAALFTAVTDSVLITVWILATGGFGSPFYLLWYLSLVAVAFRYDQRATLVATGLYVACYALLLAALGELVPNATDTLVRCAYIALVGALGVLLARETARLYAARESLVAEVEAQRRRQAEEEVERLRELDRFRTAFINAAAHEINTPLTPLQLQLHVLKQAEEDGKPVARQRAMGILHRNVERLALLVQDMLDVARLHSGKIPIHRTRSDLATVVSEAVETYRGSAEAKSVRIEVDGPASLQVDIDPQRASQILYNLVSNAVKYTLPGGRIDVRYSAEDRAVRIEVADDGLGFTADQKARMFQPFGQVHQELVALPGTGLGLFISRGIAEQHGGSLAGESPGAGRGATFVCVLSQLPDGGSDPGQAPA